MKSVILIILLLAAYIAHGQALSKEIDAIYNFQPSKLSKREQNKKIPDLDNFWDKVKNDTLTWLPQLRFALMQTGHNPYFYYDGSSLLLYVSQTSADMKLAVQAIAKCSLADIDKKNYVLTINSLSQKGVDVTSAAIKILDDDKFSFVVPEHAMVFNQDYCLIYMLLPQKNNNYINALIKRFKNSSVTAKKSIIMALWFTYSCKGDDFLKFIAADQAASNEIREYTKQISSLIELTADQEKEIRAIDSHFEEVKKNSLQKFSDEAIAELYMATIALRRKTSCH